LLRARKYDGFEFKELEFSENAFIANYYSLKNNGTKVPDSLMSYLQSFSPSILTERVDIKDWQRAIMTDIQSILGKSHIHFLETPHYKPGDCKEFEIEYLSKLRELRITKSSFLINHDIYALQFTQDKMLNDGEHWIILTNDKSLISISQKHRGWIANPVKFLDFTERIKSLSETKLISLVHSFASFSERTIAAGARIIDRIVRYASPAMQNWEFKRDIEKFKNDAITEIDLSSPDYTTLIDQKTDEFLASHQIDINEESDDSSDSVESYIQ